jgi:hypothetical protein
MPTPVTDPDLLNQLEGGGRRPVTDPGLLSQLEGSQESLAAPWQRAGQNILSGKTFQELQSGLEGLVPAAKQGTSPNAGAYSKEQYLGPATIGEGGEVFYKDAKGVPQPTDQSKHVVVDNKVFLRAPDTEEGPLTGVSRVLAPGIATTPLARTVGGITRAAEAAPTVRATEEAAPSLVTAATPGRATREEILQSSGRLGEYGSPVDIPRVIASDRYVTQQVGAGLRSIPFVGSPIIRNTEKAIQQLGEATGSVAENLGGLSSEGAGSLAKGRILDWIDSKSKAVVDKAYDAVDAAINPSVRSTLDETAKTVADITARRQNAAITAPSKAAGLVSDAIKSPADDTLAELTAQLGGTPKAAEMAAKALGSSPEAAGLTYSGIKDLRSYIGRQLKQGILPEGMDATELKQIYGALTQDLGTAAERAGGTTGKALFQRANNFYAEVAQRRKDLAEIVGLKGDHAPADVFNRITNAAKSTAREDTDLLLKAKHVIGDGWDNVVSASTADLGKTTQGIWQPGEFLRNWEKLTPAGKSALYGTGAHRQALEDIATISGRWKQLEKFQNPSGTARAVLGAGGVLHAAANPLAALAAVFEPTTMAGIGTTFFVARALAKPATAASASAWSRAYERVARAPSPAAMAQFNLASRNLANTMNSTLGTNVSPNDFLKAVAREDKR